MEPLRVAVESSGNSISWFNIMQFVLTAVIALTTTWIARQQYKVNKKRLKNELYDKRFEVYQLVDSFINDILREGKTSFDKAREFYIEASLSKFLFDDDINIYIKDLYNKAIKLCSLKDKIYPTDGSPGLPVGKERSQICEKEAGLLTWFGDQKKESVIIFRKYLEIK